MTTARITLVLALLTTLACGATRARADGMFVWHEQARDIREPEQKALLLFDHGIEDLVLEVRYEGAPAEFGWIVPLPARPRMRADTAEVFAALSRATQEPYVPRSGRAARLRMTMGGAIEPTRVLERTRVGPFDAAVLAAPDGTALRHWLRANGFRSPRGADAVFTDYARRGWVFVALRIAPALTGTDEVHGLADGTVQPIRFRFPVAEPVFPLRVSALGSPRTTVLLYVGAAAPLVHRTCTGAAWEEHACRPLPSWIASLDPDSTFRALGAGRGQLTKLRAEVAAKDMEDVYFEPLDPAVGLASGDERVRLESIALLGGMKPPGAAARLCSHLARRAATARESVAVLWALGQVGGADAIATLVRQAETGREEQRLEAVEALAALGAPEALPVFARGMKRSPSTETLFPYVTAACSEHLVALGDARVLGLLEELGRAAPAGEPGPGITISAVPFADRLLAARAACGDTAARAAIVERLVRGSDVTNPAAIRRDAGRYRGSTNGFPSGFWIGAALRMPFDGMEGWRDLSRWDGLLGPRPALHDDVFRRVAADPRVPELGRTLLLGLLAKPGRADAERVLAHARHALSGGTAPLVLELSAGFRGSTGPTRFDVPVCSAAYALARMHAADPLLALWSECRGRDEDLRGEVATAMADVASPRLAPALVDYVTTTWQARAAAPGFAAAVLASAKGRRPATWDFRSIDVDYRERSIASALAHRDVDDAVMRRLTTDRSLAPWLRLYWMQQLPSYDLRWRSLAADLRRELESMEREAASDRALRLGIEGARVSLDVGDKVYHDLVEPRPSFQWR